MSWSISFLFLVCFCFSSFFWCPFVCIRTGSLLSFRSRSPSPCPCFCCNDSSKLTPSISRHRSNVLSCGNGSGSGFGRRFGRAGAHGIWRTLGRIFVWQDLESLRWVINDLTKHLQQFFERASVHEYILTHDLADLLGFPLLGHVHPIVNGPFNHQDDAFDISLLTNPPKTKERLVFYKLANPRSFNFHSRLTWSWTGSFHHRSTKMHLFATEKSRPRPLVLIDAIMILVSSSFRKLSRWISRDLFAIRPVIWASHIRYALVLLDCFRKNLLGSISSRYHHTSTSKV